MHISSYLFSPYADDCSDSIDAVREEASVLVREEVEQRLLSIVRDSLAPAFSVKGVCYITALALIL